MDNTAGFPLRTDRQYQKLGMRGPIVNVDFTESFKKTPEEKAALKTAQKAHNKELRDAGFNPKKVMNLKVN
jgi:hypothetical protein